MKKKATILTLACAAALASSAWAQAPATIQYNGQTCATGRVIVKKKAGAAALSLRMAQTGAGITATTAVSSSMQILSFSPSRPVAAIIQNLMATGVYEYVEPDYVVSALALPNDPRFGEQWALNNSNDADVDAPEAWTQRADAEGIIVGVIDTGVDYRHPELRNTMWVNTGEIPGNAIDDDRNGYVDDVHGINAITGSGDPLDDNNHGTHCSGIIAAERNNAQGISGLAPGVKIMALKFLNANGGGQLSDALKCIAYGHANGAQILSNSWGGGGFSRAMNDAIEDLKLDGVLFVAAAGNSASDNDATPSYPASYPQDNVVAVASTTRTDGMSFFSSYGLTTVDIGAPGSEILSTITNGRYASLSGTSMATPMVSAGFALLKKQFPGETYRQLTARLYQSVDRTPAMAGKCASQGRMNIARALGFNEPQPIPDDHGNTPGTATPFALGSTLSGVLEKAGDADVFRFTVSQRGFVALVAAGATDTEGDLLNSGGGVIARDGGSAGGGNFALQRTLDAGTYYVRVTGGANATGAYQVSSRFTQPQPEVAIRYFGQDIASGDTSPNPADGTHFGSGDVVRTPYGLIRTFDVHNIGTSDLALGALRLEGGASGQFTIISQPATTVAPGRSASFTIRYQCDRIGSHDTTVVLPTNDADENPCLFAIHGEAYAGADDHSNDPYVETTRLNLGVVVSGRMEYERDNDWFRFWAEPGTYEIATSGNVNTYGYLCGAKTAGFPVLAEDNDSAGSGQFRIRYQIRTRGHYFVRVRGYGGAQGEYQVRVNSR